ncbi:MAG: hypothetical protein KBG42_01675 [Lachnospiraceae bacterium]|nr:hypothetical protein [Lachnospiraceae bacterium]
MIEFSDVKFKSEDELLDKLFNTALKKCEDNIVSFGDRDVLVEGGGYEKIWLETQPMGGRMYAKKNITVALNNQLMFMEHRRKDGRIPGSIALEAGEVIPQFNKFQGFCFPEPALDMYFVADAGEDYLDELYECLEGFDKYLWENRDSDGDGCLESWCKYDTGEDNAVRYKNAPDAWSAEFPPEGLSIVPMASLDVMSYSYSSRYTLSRIAYLKGKEKIGDEWAKLAGGVRAKIREYLWDAKAHICFDRDKHHRKQKIITHNTLRAMYWGSIDKDMASKFVNDHLLNEKEFWTYMPLPSVSVSDPNFVNEPTNNWSGQCEALTYQRAINALEKYGYDHLIPYLGRKLFDAIGKDLLFVQQYDPFTGKPSVNEDTGGRNGYGPALLSVIEYMAAMYGVRRKENNLIWGCMQGTSYEYKQILGDDTYLIRNKDDETTAFINGNKIFGTKKNVKIITDLRGNVVKATDI